MFHQVNCRLLTDYPLIRPIYKRAIIYSIVIGTSIHVRNTVSMRFIFEYIGLRFYDLRFILCVKYSTFFVLFYFHLRALVFYARVFSLSDSLIFGLD